MARLRALSFNVRQDNPEDEADAWPHRRAFVASTLRVHRPDVVGLQEPFEHQLSYLREELPGYEWVGRGRLGGREGEYCPVGYRGERFERVEAGTRWLSERPDDPGSVGWDASHARIYTWVRLRDRHGGGSILCLNTHFDHNGERARRESARVVADRAADADCPVVVTGDLNCEPASEPYRVLTEEGPLRDARGVAHHGHHGPVGTFHDFTGEPGPRIDYVLVTDSVGVVQHATLTDRRDGRYPSDHFPVVADLELPD